MYMYACMYCSTGTSTAAVGTYRIALFPDTASGAQSSHIRMAEQAAGSGAEPVLALPSAPANEGGGGETRTITVNGDPVKIDALGPVVVNSDGTIARIANWHSMTEAEQQRTLRVIGKRNRSRMAALEAAAAAAGAEK